MPGSKTYTSNKVNELFEIELYESVQFSEEKKGKSLTSTIFQEVLIIAASILGTTYYNYRFMITDTEISSSIPYPEQIRILLSHIFGFIIFYVFINGFLKLTRWLFEIIFGKRCIPSVKNQSYNQFHKKILNYIYLGVSFENKFNVYLLNNLKDENSSNYRTDFDLSITYFSQSIYYFDKAYSEIENIFPQRIKPNGRKEKSNAAFLKFIGYSHLLTSFTSAFNSLVRLNESITTLNSKLSADSKNYNFYKSAIDDLQENSITRLIDSYEGLLTRTLSLKNRYSS